jgi:hypothetical protein
MIEETVWDGDVIAKFTNMDPPLVLYVFRPDPDDGGPSLDLYSKKADQGADISLTPNLKYRYQFGAIGKTALQFEIELGERLRQLPLEKWKDEPREHRDTEKEFIKGNAKAVLELTVTPEIPEKYRNLDYERLLERATKDIEEDRKMQQKMKWLDWLLQSK